MNLDLAIPLKNSIAITWIVFPIVKEHRLIHEPTGRKHAASPFCVGFILAFASMWSFAESAVNKLLPDQTLPPFLES